MIHKTLPSTLSSLLAAALLTVFTLLAGSSPSFAQPTPASATGDYFDGGRVAEVVSRLMEKVHISQKPFDATISKIFLNNYYDSLDPVHMVFLQSDIAEFDNKYLATLSDMTKNGDISPATEIHQRYLKRLQQWQPVIQSLLLQPMDYSKDESILIDRRKEPWPKDEAEAKELWRKHIKYELLEARLTDYENAKRQDEDKRKLAEEKVKLLDEQNTLAKQEKLFSEAKKKVTPAADKSVDPLAVQIAAVKTQSDLVDSLTKALDKETKLNEKNASPAKGESVVDVLEKKYERGLKDAQEDEPVDVIALYLSSLTVAFDPHSEYQAPEEAKEFEIQTIKLSLTGIGAVLAPADDGSAKIVSLVPGGPADLNNQLRPNDRVIAVRQDKGETVNVVGMRLNKVVDMIRGPRGTKVTLTVIPGDATDSSLRKEITILRDEVKLEDQRAKAKIVERELPGGQKERLGILTLEPAFYDNTDKNYSAAEDTAKLINRMKQEGVRGVIIDMRRNGGGLLDQAVKFTALFVKDGPVVQVKDTKGTITPLLIPDNEQIYTGPLLVMTSRLSASATEIVAAALQDYGRAILVGDKTTHGKGTVQTLVRLSEFMGFSNDWDPGQLKVTIQKFYRIGGKSTQLQGVTPEIVLPSIYDYAEGYGESSLPNALPCDEIPSAKFKKIASTTSIVPYLLERSEERVRTNPDFSYLNEQIELEKKRNTEKDISLNETTRRSELDQLLSRSDAERSERDSRKPSTDKVYKLDVDMVDNKQPLKLISGPGFVPDKPKDGAASATEDDAGDDGQSREVLDMHLKETLNILHDYITGPNSSKEPTSVSNVVAKPAAS